MPDLCDKLKRERKERGLTQAAMAESLGMKRSTYSLYESGKREPNIDTLQTISNFFGITLDDLIGINTNKWNEERKKKLERLQDIASENQIDTKEHPVENLRITTINDFKLIESLITKNGNKLTNDEKLQLIKILSETN